MAKGESLTVELNHSFGDEFADELEVVPPAENPLKSDITPEMAEENARRLAAEDLIRASHDHINHSVEQFRLDYPERAEKVLSLLSSKDLADVKYPVLEDALLGTGSARVEIEHLRPYRAEILESDQLKGLSTKENVMRT